MKQPSHIHRKYFNSQVTFFFKISTLWNFHLKFDSLGNGKKLVGAGSSE
jgi:hypothetical protein